MAPKKSTQSSAKPEKKSEDKQKITIKAEKRTALGKATRSLRKTGMLPANIFGKDIKSQSIQVQALDFRHTYTAVRETGVVYVDVEGKATPCMIRNIQRHPISGSIIHADFQKINLKQKTEAEVPIKIVGESEAVKSHNGVLMTQLETITIEALPTDIPSEIEIDISALKEIGDQIKVSDLKATDKIAYKDEPESVIVSVTEHKEEDTEPDTTTEEPEVESGEKKEGEAEEKPADSGEEKATEEKSE